MANGGHDDDLLHLGRAGVHLLGPVLYWRLGLELADMKTITEMTRELGGFAPTTEFLERFAELVRADERDRAMRENAYVAAEREACAEVCEAFGKMALGVFSAAAAIRARGQA